MPDLKLSPAEVLSIAGREATRNRATWKTAIDAEINRIQNRTDSEMAQLEREKQVAEGKNANARRAMAEAMVIIESCYNCVEPEHVEKLVVALSRIKQIIRVEQMRGEE